MVRQPVTSSNLRSVGYDVTASLLEIEFRDGGVYQYRNVPESIYQNLMSAGSKGTYFNDHIKGRYGDTPVG